MLRRVGGGEPVLVTDRTSTAHSGDQYYFILPSSRACSGSEGGRVDFSWLTREVWSNWQFQKNYYLPSIKQRNRLQDYRTNK